MALVGWASAALKYASRDRWIGWLPTRHWQRLNWIANNSRVLLLPGERGPNLASRILGLTLARLSTVLAGGAGAAPATGRDLHQFEPLSRDLRSRGQLDRRGGHARRCDVQRHRRGAWREQADLGVPSAPTRPTDPVLAPATPGITPPRGETHDADRSGCDRIVCPAGAAR